MSDIQELIHKTSMDCIEKGKTMEHERIVKLLQDKWVELVKANRLDESNYYRHTIALIKGKTE
jgi:hypothetical protein